MTDDASEDGLLSTTVLSQHMRRWFDLEQSGSWEALDRELAAAPGGTRRKDLHYALALVRLTFSYRRQLPNWTAARDRTADGLGDEAATTLKGLYGDPPDSPFASALRRLVGLPEPAAAPAPAKDEGKPQD